ncbi:MULTISPECIES: hypothetical protein [Candidatus Nitrosocaldus]|jgi:uncharacterized membrane protein YdjX (TVP38/TMEM64 family)|uniref:Heme exporter protein D n=1 Tax=Candidatus Nitrosocaldus cavascurensis TaxID=2058097 RepID=A0A2K5ANL9_9ARCH|nr:MULTISPECIES: hypothetical protein [Candidatus Nitrosocaldus]GBC73350.1 hypothetical protein HRbin04_00747 [archaeon HR04]SPC33233.1 protein of unknown function [Candidatus Nitrosocaldus cavascurensis]
MAEPFIGTMYAMTAVFAAAVAVWFSIRAYRHSKMVEQEEEVREERTELG